MGKSLGPMPVKTETPVKPATATAPTSNPNLGKLPELPTPLGFPVRDTVKQTLPVLPVADSLIFPEELADTIGLRFDEPVPSQPGLTYRVQVFAFAIDQYSAESIKAKYKLNQPVYKEFSEGWYRYTVGPYKSFKEAKTSMYRLRNHGVKSAFVARYNNGIRTPSHPKP
jgi:hypothetical protein